MEAAVIVPVYRTMAGDLRLIVIRRGAGGIHGGQLAFPGGKVEPGDRSPLAAALRETEEEIGVRVGREQVLAELPVVETIASGFLIFPFLARITRPGEWRLAEREVAEVLEVEVASLVNQRTVTEERVDLEGWEAALPTSFFQIGAERFWGASYRILAPLLPRLIAGEWEI